MDMITLDKLELLKQFAECICTRIANMDHACLSGDCPHSTQEECNTELVQEFLCLKGQYIVLDTNKRLEEQKQFVMKFVLAQSPIEDFKYQWKIDELVNKGMYAYKAIEKAIQNDNKESNMEDTTRTPSSPKHT